MIVKNPGQSLIFEFCLPPKNYPTCPVFGLWFRQEDGSKRWISKEQLMK